MPLLMGLLAIGMMAMPAETPVPSTATHWAISGEVAESCTCHVPCTCEFGQGPSPGPGCQSVIAFAIDRGAFGATSVAGRKFAIVLGHAGVAAYVDAAASAEERGALKGILEDIAAKSGFKLASLSEASIDEKCDATTTTVRVGDAGGFEAEMLLGFDGKSPVVVENNGDFNVPRLEKGKTKTLDYHDAAGNTIHAERSNSSRGHFDWSDATKRFF